MRGVGKAYRIFGSKLDNFIDAVGLDHLMPWYHSKTQDFWALRGIDLELAKGQRIGIVGRNGAGKTTLLKLITGNLTPTTGTVRVNGKIQAMLDAGTGFHPDFTGRENIRASLTLQGFTSRQIAESTEDIADFTELGEFLDRPFKTYSSGMAARLIFATATAIRPEILIIDEILGAGDGYFIGKSSERMRQLVGTGASILLVSHSMETITLMCDKAIWLDRGRIVKAGPSLDVVKAYGQYIRVLEDRRLRARNQKVASRRRIGNDLMESYADTVVLRFVVPPGADLAVSHARLLRDDGIEEECAVGDAQDSDSTHPSFVVIDSGAWSAPAAIAGTLSRSIRAAGGVEASGQIAFNLFTLYPTIRYFAEVEYRLDGPPVSLEVSHAGRINDRFELGATPGGGFEPARFPLTNPTAIKASPPPLANGHQLVPEPPEKGSEQAHMEAQSAVRERTRWPGEGSLLIDKVELIGEDGSDCAVYQPQSRMRLAMTVRAVEGGRYPITPVAVLYRFDGVKVFSHIGEAMTIDLKPGDTRCFDLDLGRLNLGNGQYAFALAIYRTLDPLGQSTWYDLIDRDYRFEVVEAPAFMGMFDHDGRWTIS